MKVISFNQFMDGSHNKKQLPKKELLRKKLYHYETFIIVVEVLLVVAAVIFPVVTALSGGIPLPFGIPEQVLHAFFNLIQ